MGAGASINRDGALSNGQGPVLSIFGPQVGDTKAPAACLLKWLVEVEGGEFNTHTVTFGRSSARFYFISYSIARVQIYIRLGISRRQRELCRLLRRTHD